MYDRGVLVITIKLDYSKAPSTGTAVLLRNTMSTTVETCEKKLQVVCFEGKRT